MLCKDELITGLDSNILKIVEIRVTMIIDESF